MTECETCGHEPHHPNECKDDMFGSFACDCRADSAGPLHGCPYQADVNDDPRPCCHCGPEQEEECRDDI